MYHLGLAASEPYRSAHTETKMKDCENREVKSACGNDKSTFQKKKKKVISRKNEDKAKSASYAHPASPRLV